MGAPGYTEFCENGHIVKLVGHHEINDDEVEVCPCCNSSKFYTQNEWGDTDYHQFVPTKPKKTEKIAGTKLMDFITPDGLELRGYPIYDTPVYDISRLKKQQGKNENTRCK